MRISDVSISQIRAFRSDDVQEADSPGTGTGKITPFDAHGQFRNALAPRGGLAFDGTAATRIRSDLSGQSLGAVPKSIVVVAEIPAANPAGFRCIAFVGSSPTADDAANTLTLYVTTAGKLDVALYGASSADYRDKRSTASVVSLYGGKRVIIAVACNADGTLSVYVNGTALAMDADTTGGAAPANWLGSVTSSYFVVGTLGWAGAIYGASLYNLALSAADAREIFELGGAVPFKYQFGSQAELIAVADDRTFASDTGFWNIKAGGATISGGAANMGNGEYIAHSLSLGFQAGKAYRWTANSTGDALRTWDGNVVDYTLGIPTGAQSIVAVVPAGASGALYVGSNGGVGITLDSLSIVRVGAIVHLPLNEGIGYQLHDESTNKLDAVMTTTGVSHLIPKRIGFVRGTLSWSATHEGKSLIGQRALPPGAVLTLATLKASAGSSGSGATLGTTNSATRWSTAAVFTTAKKVLTLANQLPASDTGDSDNDLIVDPDTANFTGTIQAEVHYANTEGTAS